MTCICGGKMKRRGTADSAGGVLWRCDGNPVFRSCGRTRVTHPPLERTPRSVTDLKERFVVREIDWADEVREERRWSRKSAAA